jgi:gentisate 1,2-dioxygenase
MIKQLGYWPCDPKAVRETGEFVKVTDENKLRTIHGLEYPVPVNFFFSTDLGHMGEITLPSGGNGPRSMEKLTLKGDASIYVEDGPITFFFPDNQDTFTVADEEVVFIPANTPFMLINYEAKVVHAIFSVGGPDF